MSPRARNEVSYYPEMMDYLKLQLESNFASKGRNDIKVFCKIGELSSKLREIIVENPDKCACLTSFAQNVPPLNLDIFAVITDGEHYELLILEVKLLPSVGLNQWSQLVGYCIVSNAKYGLLVNVDSGGSSRLVGLLQNEENLSLIVRQCGQTTVEHHLGFMQWDSLTHNFEYTNLGHVVSLSDLCNQIIGDFTR